MGQTDPDATAGRDGADGFDFFIAHASEDRRTAEHLHDALSGLRVFLDSRDIQVGDDWAQTIERAQRSSRFTIALVSVHLARAFYALDEIRAGIDRERESPGSHRVVPLYITGLPRTTDDYVYGLRSKQGMSIDSPAAFDGAVTELRKLADHAAPAASRTPIAMPLPPPAPPTTSPLVTRRRHLALVVGAVALLTIVSIAVVSRRGGSSASTATTTPPTTVPAPSTPPASTATVAPAVEQSTSAAPTRSTAPAATTATSTPIVLPAPVTFSGKTFWLFARFSTLVFEVDFKGAQVNRESNGTWTLRVDGTATNLSETDIGFGATASLTSGGDRRPLDCASDSKVPGGESSSTTCTASGLRPTFTFDDAVVTFGNAQSNDSIVPLRTGVAPTTFKPLVGFANGRSFSAGRNSTATVRRSILYPDYRDGHRDQYFVQMLFDWTIVEDAPGGEQIAVTFVSPDGNASAGEHDTSGMIASQDQFQGGAGSTRHPGLYWTMRAPVSGHYVIKTVSRTGRLGYPVVDGGFEFDLTL